MTINSRTGIALATLALAIAPTVAAAGMCGCPTDLYHPVTLSFFPPISTNGCPAARVKTNFALNILGGYVGALEGVELGGLFNVEKYDATGFQLAGLVNRVGGSFTGLEIALLNCVCGDASGVQLGGFNHAGGDVLVTQLGVGNCAGRCATTQFGAANFAGGSTALTLGGFNICGGNAGLQLAGVNLTRHQVWWAQLGGVNLAGGCATVQLGGFNGAGGNTVLTLGGINLGGADNVVALGGFNLLRGATAFQLGAINAACGAGERDELGLLRTWHQKSSGAQVGAVNIAGASVGCQVGAVNIAHDVRWFQLGAFNFARESEIPVGPLNVILNGQFRVQVFASEAGLAHLELKTGGRRFYNVLGFAYHPIDTARVMFGYGVGLHFPCPCPRLYVDADLVGYRVNPTDDLLSFDGTSYLAKVRATGGWEIAPPFALIGGLAANVWLSDAEDGSDIPILEQVPMYTKEGDTNISIWPGVLFGFEFRAW